MKNIKLSALIAALAVGVSLPVLAHADHHGGKGKKGMMFEMLDANADGNVTKAEVEAANAARFAEIDANSDGELTKDEMTAHREAKRAEWEAKRAERMAADPELAEKYAERKAKRAERLAADPELAAKYAERKAKRAEGKGDRSGRGGDRFAKADTDGNGTISLAEFNPGAMKHFERADADGDGVITTAEHEAMAAKHKGKRGKHHRGDKSDAPKSE